MALLDDLHCRQLCKSLSLGNLFAPTMQCKWCGCPRIGAKRLVLMCQMAVDGKCSGFATATQLAGFTNAPR